MVYPTIVPCRAHEPPCYTPRCDHDHVYKIQHRQHGEQLPATRPLTSSHLSYRAVAVGISIMVSAWLLTKVFVVFGPITVAYAQCNTTVKLPLLLDATAEELTAGLETGAFTSLDLVEVRITAPSWTLELVSTPVSLTNMTLGLCRTHS
jgi:hypothetical protein